MNRSALIIGSPDEKIPGVRQDMVNYRRFLESPLGGMWLSSEIETLESPSLAVVQQKLQRLKSADYSFVVFAGHGHHPKRDGSTFVVLQPGVEIDADELKIGAEKHTLILDCCRELRKERVLDSVMAKSESISEALNTRDCRIYFDQWLASCGKGIVTLFACGIDETAGEDGSTGGYYSSALMTSADEWQRQQKVDINSNYRVLQITKAHEMASAKVQRRSGQRQNPMCEYTRSERQFPFAIIA